MEDTYQTYFDEDCGWIPLPKGYKSNLEDYDIE